jgi:6-hydroxycyclohex-1-ene-1-carbonyl-CoA dehydrogenase
MRAALFYGPNQPLAITEVTDPVPTSDEILVRVAACGLCHTDLHYIDHNVPTFKKPPVILGHEASGVVERVGERVTGLKPGDRVLLPAVLTCDSCRMCARGRSNICENMRMYGNHIDGAFAECVTAPARQAFKLPPEIPLEEACIIGDAVTTAYHAVVDRGQIQPGDRVAVFGCGGVGINVVQIAAAFGGHVIAVDAVESKLELARSLGARETILAGAGRAVAKEIRKSGGVDTAFECIGNPAVIREAHDSIRRGGRLCVVGYCEKPVELAVSKIMFNEQDVVGSLGCPPSKFPEVIHLVKEGKIKIKPLISERFTLTHINAGLDKLRRGVGIRNIVYMETS